jgi:flagellar motility protein MotE (MotC chaperone)
MDKIMADEMQQEELQQENKTLDKKQLKAAKKLEKKKKKQKNADDLDGEEETVGGKILVFFVTIIIILIWLAIFAMLIKLDVGGFGSGVLAPVIKDVPYLNKILPDSAVEEVSTEDSQYAYTNLDDAINRIKELEIELADAQNSANSDADYIAELEEKAKELDTYKQNEAAFEQEKEKWYEDVVFSDDAPDISNYKEYYESIDAANAEVLYKQVVEQTLTDEQMDDYVKTYSNMKPKEAAAIFDTMTDNLQLVADILSNLDTQSRADILGKMNSDTAAKVTEIMEPSE